MLRRFRKRNDAVPSISAEAEAAEEIRRAAEALGHPLPDRAGDPFAPASLTTPADPAASPADPEDATTRVRKSPPAKAPAARRTASARRSDRSAGGGGGA